MDSATLKADVPTIQEKQAAVRQWLGTGSINLFGTPFAGKEEQAGRLAGWLGAEVIPGGEILRRADLPPEVAAMRDAGDLIPIEDYLRVVVPFLLDERLAGQSLVYSSVGRYHGEEESVMRASCQAGHPLRRVILLDVGPDVIWQRWEARFAGQSRGTRADDDRISLENRLAEYRTKTHPVLEFYCRRGLLAKVDGSGKPAEVAEAVLDSLFSFAQREG